jgi:hypothetical protein
MKIEDFSRYNEIFLDEMVVIDFQEYSISIFFNCDRSRFERICLEYRKIYGVGALNYMLDTFHSWKRGYVNPNVNTKDKIIAATMATYDSDEKFLFAFSSLVRFINSKFLKYSSVKSLYQVFIEIIEIIDKFDLRYSQSFGHRIYEISEAKGYESSIKGIFKFYCRIIFSGVSKDLQLIRSLSLKINSEYLKLSYRTYLFGINIFIQDLEDRDLLLLEKCDWGGIGSEDIFRGLSSNGVRLENILKLAKTYRTTEFEGFLSTSLINEIHNRVQSISETGMGGDIKCNLRLSGGFVKMEIRLMSRLEAGLLFLRIFLFLLSSVFFFYWTLTKGVSFFIVLGYIVAFTVLIGTKYDDLLCFIKNLRRKKWKRIT